jgi:glycosyltransferase involved in cell wall biosynthesis
MIITIFTQSYPYDFAAEQTFISREIYHLLEKFDRVVLVPKICRGGRLPLPAKVEVDDHYAAFLEANSYPHQIMKQAFRLSRFYKEIQKNKTILLYPSKFLKLILFSARAELTRQWLVAWLREQRINSNDGVLYSYWFNHLAAGLGMVKYEFPDVKVVSRAHGYDIYEEYYYPYYWPYRYETLENINRLFFASEAGKIYFCEHYPDFVSKYETAHLGVSDPEFVSQPSEDNVFRIVSCSAIVSVKRIDLLLNGLATMARLRPGQKIEWVHFGDGGDRQALSRKLQQIFPINITGRFLGYVPNYEILRYYREHPVDAFVNVSKTEGGAPVAIQEAISCGIPVVATSVGGNPEIVTQENGVQLSPDASPDEIARALFELIDNPAATESKRKRSREIWKQKYDADHNFSLFAQSLKAIRDAN